MGHDSYRKTHQECRYNFYRHNKAIAQLSLVLENCSIEQMLLHKCFEQGYICSECSYCSKLALLEKALLAAPSLLQKSLLPAPRAAPKPMYLVPLLLLFMDANLFMILCDIIVNY